MDILTNKDKILEEHARHVARVEGKPFKEIKTYQVTPDDLAEIKQVLMVILSKVRGIDAYIRQSNNFNRNRDKPIQGEYSKGTDPNERPEKANLFIGEAE